MAKESVTAPATLEEAMAALVPAWNNVAGVMHGSRLLHRLFGSAIGGKTAGHCFATRMDGHARVIGAEERLTIQAEIELVRAEAEKAARVAAGLE